MKRSVIHRWGGGALALLMLAGLPLLAQRERLEVHALGALHSQVQDLRASAARGFGGGGRIAWGLTEKLAVSFEVGADYTALTQSDVLDEWDWAYWEETYIDFLPGADVAEVNRTLRYASGDGIYTARFDPSQSMREIRLTAGLAYDIPVTGRFSGFVGLDVGASLFRRELKMTEHWEKNFDLDTAAVGTDYVYELDLLHYAPAKTGTRLIAMPALGLRWALMDALDLELAGRFVYYGQRDSIEWLEDLLGIGADSQQWFPFKSKAQLTLGLRFRY